MPSSTSARGPVGQALTTLAILLLRSRTAAVALASHAISAVVVCFVYSGVVVGGGFFL